MWANGCTYTVIWIYPVFSANVGCLRRLLVANHNPPLTISAAATPAIPYTTGDKPAWMPLAGGLFSSVVPGPLVDSGGGMVLRLRSKLVEDRLKVTTVEVVRILVRVSSDES